MKGCEEKPSLLVRKGPFRTSAVLFFAATALVWLPGSSAKGNAARRNEEDDRFRAAR